MEFLGYDGSMRCLLRPNRRAISAPWALRVSGGLLLGSLLVPLTSEVWKRDGRRARGMSDLEEQVPSTCMTHCAFSDAR